MVTVTDAAMDYLSSLRSQKATQEGSVLKLVPSGTQIGFTVSSPEPGDEVISRDEETILHISPSLVEPLSGATIDVQQANDGSKLVISR